MAETGASRKTTSELYRLPLTTFKPPSLGTQDLILFRPLFGLFVEDNTSAVAMSALRILVPVKRVIDYAVRTTSCAQLIRRASFPLRPSGGKPQ